jgi:hypothetical protein
LAERLFVALVHYPVVDKNGEPIASAVTNLDLHDIARACRTYGVGGYYVVTPLDDQQRLVHQILHHWLTGAGGRYNPERREALERVRVTETFAGAVDDIAAATGHRPVCVATSARPRAHSVTCRQVREMLDGPVPVLLAFGTAWGLADGFMDAADHILKPIRMESSYNHLSVRSAVAIFLDRLLGD